MRTKLKEGEQVELINKLHWSILVAPIAAIVLIFILYSYLAFSIEMEQSHWVLVGLVGALPWLGYQVLIRNTNLWVITNLRVINEFGLITQNVKETPLDRINNIILSKPFWGRILDYGDIEIQTAAQEGSTVHKTISHPELLRDTIFELRENRLQRQHNGDNNHQIQVPAAKSLADELRELGELMGKGILTQQEFEEAKKKLLK